jgi:hypothetical protein
MDIKKIEAYKIYDKIFETIEEANDYKYQKIDNVKLGDIVSTNGGFKNFYGNFGLEGIVCCIEDDLIWFLEGNCPQDWIMNGNIKYSCTKIEIGNRTYTWNVMNRHRKDLWRRPLKFINENFEKLK